MKEFSKITTPMSNLLKGKNNIINWTHKCDLSFQTWKPVLTQTPILTIMDPLKINIILCIDVSDLVISAVIMQDKKIIAYESRKLNFAELNYAV